MNYEKSTKLGLGYFASPRVFCLPWPDKAITRSASGWLCIVTKDYKLVYAKNDIRGKALLIDRKKDPTESDNEIDNPALAPIIKTLTQDLLTYCKTHNDPHLTWLEKRLKH